MQVQMADIQARTELSKARATADQGLGMERMSRIARKQALAEERKHESRKDDEVALLNLVKALKEIDTMDLSHIEQLIRMSNDINKGRTSSLCWPKRLLREKRTASRGAFLLYEGWQNEQR